MRVFAGIDIAAKSFDLATRQGGRVSKVVRFEQTPEGHAQAVARLKALKPGVIVMEATGIYFVDLAFALTEAGLPVAVINPKSFKHFAKLTLTQSKTDAGDARLLAEYGERMKPALWTPPGATQMALQAIGRQLNRLTGDLTRAKNRLHAFSAKRTTPGVLIKDEKAAIGTLERRIARLRTEALKRIAADDRLASGIKHLTAACGIGEVSAIATLAELCVLPEHLKATQVSRFAGLDVRLTRSGTSVRGAARISKAGNQYLRAALYMPAMSAVQHDARAKAFYESLLSRGKKKRQALCAVMRKYLTGLWVAWRDETEFDSSLLFSDIHMKG